MIRTTSKKYTFRVEGIFAGGTWFPLRTIEGDFKYDTIARMKLYLKRLVQHSAAYSYRIFYNGEYLAEVTPTQIQQMNVPFKKYM